MHFILLVTLVLIGGTSSLYTGEVEHGHLRNRASWSESGENSHASGEDVREGDSTGQEQPQEARQRSSGGSFSGPGLLIAGLPESRIAYCESGITNGQNPVSSASEYFQFVDATWRWVTELDPPASDYSYATQLEAFHKLWDDGRGASHWAPSRSCWEYNEPWDHFIRP